MMFTEQLAVAIVKGEKTQTRRRQSPNRRSPWRGPEHGGTTYEVGQTFTVNPGRGVKRVAECEVVDVSLRTIGQMTDADFRAEGFADRRQFFDAWSGINGSLDQTEEVWVIEFKLVGERCGWCLGDAIQNAGPCPECFGSGKAVSEAARDLIERVEAAA